MVYVTKLVWDTLEQGPTTAAIIAEDLINHCQGDLAGAVAAVSSLKDVARQADALPGAMVGASSALSSRRRGRGRGSGGAWSGPGEKNIRRRVYDAINVLKALDLVHEDENRFLSRTPSSLLAAPTCPPAAPAGGADAAGSGPTASGANAAANEELDALRRRLEALRREQQAFAARAAELRFMNGLLSAHLSDTTIATAAAAGIRIQGTGGDVNGPPAPVAMPPPRVSVPAHCFPPHPQHGGPPSAPMPRDFSQMTLRGLQSFTDGACDGVYTLTGSAAVDDCPPTLGYADTSVSRWGTTRGALPGAGAACRLSHLSLGMSGADAHMDGGARPGGCPLLPIASSCHAAPPASAGSGGGAGGLGISASSGVDCVGTAWAQATALVATGTGAPPHASPGTAAPLETTAGAPRGAKQEPDTDSLASPGGSALGTGGAGTPSSPASVPATVVDPSGSNPTPSQPHSEASATGAHPQVGPAATHDAASEAHASDATMASAGAAQNLVAQLTGGLAGSAPARSVRGCGPSTHPSPPGFGIGSALPPTGAAAHGGLLTSAATMAGSGLAGLGGPMGGLGGCIPRTVGRLGSTALGGAGAGDMLGGAAADILAAPHGHAGGALGGFVPGMALHTTPSLRGAGARAGGDNGRAGGGDGGRGVDQLLELAATVGLGGATWHDDGGHAADLHGVAQTAPMDAPPPPPRPGAGDGVVPPFVLQLVRRRPGDDLEAVGAPLRIDWAMTSGILRALRDRPLAPVVRTGDGVYALGTRSGAAVQSGGAGAGASGGSA